MKKKLTITLTIVVASTILTSLLAPTPVSAGGTVGNGNPASCTEAAFDAAFVGGGLISFNCGPNPVTISFTGTKHVTVDTAIDGGNLITLSGGGSVFLFLVFPNITLTVKNLEISDGRNTTNGGGAIRNFGSVVLTNTVVANNQAPGLTGGSIYNEGELTISYSLFYNNSASGGMAGAIDNFGSLIASSTTFFANYSYYHSGGIANHGTAEFYSTVFDSNHANAGGAIYNLGSLTIVDGTFGNNYAASGEGGAIYNDSVLAIDTSAFSGNTSGDFSKGGALFNSSVGVADIKRTAFIENSSYGGVGGGIANSGQLTVSENQFSANSTNGGLGGAIYSNSGQMIAITNSTFSSNNGGLYGGGLYTSGPAIAVNSTFYNNQAGGIVNNSGSSNLYVKNTILAGNNPYNCYAATSLGFNIEDAFSCSFTGPGDLSNTDPQIGPLVNNGGPTQTHALLLGSPAINAGTNDQCPTIDQRGMGRPRFGTCDVGAYEFGRVSFFPLVIK